MSKIFKKSAVAFVDLLGFQQALNTEENVEGILDILKQIKSGEKSNCAVSINAIESIAEIKIIPAISAFSDNMVISVSEELFSEIVSWRHAVIEILNIIQQLANFAIEKGFLIRGGISIGDLYHKDGVLLGPAFIDAYILESKKAIFPRILVSQKLVDCFNLDRQWGTKDYFLKDIDGHYYLDYLSVALTYSNQSNTYQRIIQEKIVTLTNSTIKDESKRKILDKWLWFKDYYQKTIDKISTISNA